MGKRKVHKKKGPLVRKRNQAVAIALSEGRRAGGGKAAVRRKVGRVMSEFKHHKLHSGAGAPRHRR